MPGALFCQQGEKNNGIKGGEVKTSVENIGNKRVDRFEFETFEELEYYFLKLLADGISDRTKVIGKVLLVWKREEE